MENLLSGCSSVFDLSLKNFGNYVNLKGNKEIELTHGYKSVIDKLIEPHEKAFAERLRLNHSLAKISVVTNDANQNRVELKFEKRGKDGVVEEVVVTCDRIVCTMSLGVLKERIRDLIEPSSLVSRAKLDAIDRLGFGTVNKVFKFILLVIFIYLFSNIYIYFFIIFLI